jgi:hypothetical protein
MKSCDYSDASATLAQPPAEITTMLGSVRENLCRLESVVEKLEHRLHQVLAPCPEEGACAKSPHAPITTELGSELYGVAGRIEAQCDRIGRVIRQCEL